MTARMAGPRPSAGHLSPHDLSRLRAALVSDLDLQRRQVAEQQATAWALLGQTDTDSMLERELAERGEQHSLEVIAEIQHALARVDEDEYGICERCAEPIAMARLEAIPHTRSCVDCPPTVGRLLG